MSIQRSHERNWKKRKRCDSFNSDSIKLMTRHDEYKDRDYAKVLWKLACSPSRHVVQVDRNPNLKTNLRWRCTIFERVMSDQRCCLLIINKKLGRKVNQPGIVLIILKTDSSLYLYKVCFVLLINQGRTSSFGRALYCRAEVTG